MLAELERLESHLGGVADMKRQPDAMLVVDLRKEAIAVREAKRLGLPVVALVDTNCDPDEADYVIPGNDDAIKAADLVIRTIANAIEAGKQKVTPEELRAEPAPEAAEPPAEELPADEQMSPGESAEETVQAEAAPSDEAQAEAPAEAAPVDEPQAEAPAEAAPIEEPQAEAPAEAEEVPAE